MKCRALLFMPLDSVNDLVGWRDLGGNQLAVLLLVGHGHFRAGLQALSVRFLAEIDLFEVLELLNCVDA